MNAISQTIYDYWHRGRVKNSPNGWTSGNAVCCEHRGEKPDKRGRGGFKFELDGSLVYHCFNCNYSANYSVGKPIYPKLEKLLLWLGLDSKTINQLKLEAIRSSQNGTVSPAIQKLREIKPVELPEVFLLRDNASAFPNHAKFIESRGFAVDIFPFLTSNHPTFRSRVLIPFIRQNIIVGYSARSINPMEKTRYLMRSTTDFVFGMDFVEPEHQWVIVTEGIFDALSIRGLGVMHNEISDTQAEMIHDLKNRIIVVPDLDYAGLKSSPNSLINTALDYDWDVAFPSWNVKDINAAFLKYGPLATVQHILKNTTSDKITIRVKQKLLSARNK